MLESITIRNVATFDNQGIQLNDLKKVNFIYGVNGSGKTTLTKLIDKPSESQFTSSSLVWKGGTPIKALIYNKDFREANFGKGKIDGVFTLGKASKEELEEIQKLNDELNGIKEKGIKKKETLDKVGQLKDQLENDYKESFWFDIYKNFEEEFKEAFRGVMQKETFKARILDEFQGNSTELKSYDELKKKADTIFGKAPQTMPSISTINFSRIIEIETDTIWQKKIIGKSDVEIAKLIQRLNLNDWVNEGRNYLQEDETCPFCQKQTITRDFRKQLEDYFDETFVTDTEYVKECSAEYNLQAQNLLSFLQGIENAEKVNQGTKLNLESFSAYLSTVSSQFVSNRELLNNKIKEPSRGIELVSVRKQLENIEQIITEANEAINEHNLIVSNLKNEKTELINSIWKYITEKYKSRIQAYIKKRNGLQKGIEALTNQHKDLQNSWTSLNKRIQAATKNITSVQPSVDEINNTLKSYGFLNFEIVPSTIDKNQYQIQREDGTIAESTLSEGEITFITFLYFMQLSKGSTSQETISEERILVIDDPISSLDSNVLFIVSSLIKEVIKSIKKNEGNIKQLILLTHNVYFHKEVSFVDGRTPENGDTVYWILRRNNKVSEIQPFGMRNPIHTSYELLWQELKNRDNSIITTQNIMRRIIENYFKLLGRYGDDDLIKKFPTIPDQEICRSLICWINDGSHGIPDDLYVEHQETAIDKYQEVFKNIFVYTGHKEHYKMMLNEPSA